MEYILKYIPEDFIVEELSNVQVKESGNYLLCRLTKRDYDQQDALRIIAEKLNISLKNIGFAGTKDKKAVTTQLISLKSVKLHQLKKVHIKDIKLEFAGYSDQPVRLGFLKGNKFSITARDLPKSFSEADIDKISEMPNYFGEQRFSKNNVEMGLCIIKGDLKRACSLIVDSGDRNAKIINRYLAERKNDCAGALLNAIPLKTLKMYIHAVQAEIFNNTLLLYMQLGGNAAENLTLPLVGFGTEFSESATDALSKKIIDGMGLKQRDFIIPKMPILSSEGGIRTAFTEIKNLSYSIEDDELFREKKKCVLNFELEKGSYATVTVLKFFANKIGKKF